MHKQIEHPLATDLDHILKHTGGVWEQLRRQRVFMTGGTGFVGTWLTESLTWADTNFDLGVELVLLTRNPERFRSKVPHIAGHKAVTMLAGDCRDFAFPDGKFGFLIHAATESHTASTDSAPAGSFDSDVAGTRRVLEFARRSGVRRMLFTSSGAVYGIQPKSVLGTPEDYPGAPLTTDLKSAYEQAKRASEFLCAMYSQQFGFCATIARLFAFVGPYLPLERYAVGNFILDALNGRPITIRSDGSAERSYLYAADLAIWLWKILLAGKSMRPYNVGSPEALNMCELAAVVADASGTGARVNVLARPGVPATRYVPDTSRAEDELGLRAHIALQEGLRRTLAWFQLQTASPVPITDCVSTIRSKGPQ